MQCVRVVIHSMLSIIINSIVFIHKYKHAHIHIQNIYLHVSPARISIRAQLAIGQPIYVDVEALHRVGLKIGLDPCGGDGRQNVIGDPVYT